MVRNPDLLKFANTPLGRRLFGVPEGKEVIRIPEGSVHYYTGKLSKNPKNHGAPVICAQGSPGGVVVKRVLHLLRLFPEAIKMAEIGLEYPLPLVVLADTGWKSPTETGSFISQWTNPTNVYSSNNEYATAGNMQNQDYHTYGSGIPEGAVIDGIEISVEGKVDETMFNPIMGCSLYAVDPLKNPAPQTTPTWTLSDVVYTVGAPDDLWDTEWVPSDFADGNLLVILGTYFEGPFTTYYIDHTQLKVYYTEAPSGPPGVKTINEVPIADVKTICDVPIADVKTIQDAA